MRTFVAGISLRFLTELLCLTGVFVTPAHGTGPNNQVGINLWLFNDFNNTFAFTDLVKRSRPWGSVEQSFVPINNVDKLGWPKQDAGLFLHVSQQQDTLGNTVNGPAPLPAGTYKIIFKGRANAIAPSVGVISNKIFDPITNTTRANWKIALPAFDNVSISFTDTRRTNSSSLNTGLTDLRIFLPGFPDDGSVVFTPDFLALVEKFQIIRFMDWMGINLNPIQAFAERTLPTHATQARHVPLTDRPDLDFPDTTSGVAFEHMVQLCNATGTDMWINVPARANDDFVRKMLLLIRDGNPALGFSGLNPNRKLYVEFANEIWNSSAGFLSFSRIKAQSDAALIDPAHPINFDGNTSPFIAFFRFIAFRAKTISDLCREVFGDTNMMTRVRPVLASQFGDGQATFSTELRFLSEFFGVLHPNNPTPLQVNQILFGGGGAPYSVGSITSKDDFFNTLPQAAFVPSARIDATLAHGYGINYLAYEGGPSIADPVNGQASLDAVTARDFNADPRMKSALIDTHNQWSRAGGDIFVYYATTGDSAFEFTPSEQQRDTPKLQAVDALRTRATASTTTGRLVPSTFLAISNPHLINEGNFLNLPENTAVLRAQSFAGRGQFFLPVHTSGSHPVNLTVRLETLGSATGGTIDVFFNGVKLKRMIIPPPDVAPAFVFRSAGAVTTRFGLNVLRIVCVKGEVQLRNVIF